MNIEKLAKHLKEFTLDEIEMIAECDCKTELEHLLNRGKIIFEQGLYKYQEEKPKQEFIIYTKQVTNFQVITFDTAVNMGVGVVKATGMTRNTEFLKAAQYTYPEKYIAAKKAKYYEFAKYGNQKKFLNGWLNRLNDMEKFIKTL